MCGDSVNENNSNFNWLGRFLEFKGLMVFLDHLNVQSLHIHQCDVKWFPPEGDRHHLRLAAIYHTITPSPQNPPPSPSMPNQQQSYLQKNIVWWQLEVSWLRQLMVKMAVSSHRPPSLTHSLCIQGLVIFCSLQLHPHLCSISHWPSWLWLKFLALTIGDQCVAVYGTSHHLLVGRIR